MVLAIDAKRRYGREEGREIIETPEGPCWFECSFYGGREFTGIDAIAWAKDAVSRGAGEILLTSMDRDGTRAGYDLELLEAVCGAVSIPVIASGGVGTLEHLAEGLRFADAALAASIFHDGQHTVQEAKAFLRARGIEVRP
ncbi:MAG TPA: HisA/HisF-related TIM barrel protein [Anaeromyxobacteraceae bacterium]